MCPMVAPLSCTKVVTKYNSRIKIVRCVNMAEATEIVLLVKAVEGLAVAQANTNAKVDKLVESMGKQEAIIEKLANVEKTSMDSNRRVHKRLDDAIISRIKSTDELGVRVWALEKAGEVKESEVIRKTQIDGRLKHVEAISVRLEPFATLLQYPKAVFLMCAGLYLFAIQEIRLPIMTLLGVG